MFVQHTKRCRNRLCYINNTVCDSPRNRFSQQDKLCETLFLHLCVHTKQISFDVFRVPSRSTRGKDAMPSGGDGSSCSPIRAIGEAFARRAFSPRAVRAPRPAMGEPIVQIDRDQIPQPTNGTNPVPGAADQQVTMISIPAGGPDDGQMMAPYVQQPQPATSDFESAVGLATTLTCEGAPIGDEEPSGLFMSDTDPLTDPSIDREVPAAGNSEDPAEAADRPAPDEQDGSGQPTPSGSLHTVLNMLSGVNSGLQVRQQAVPEHIQVTNLFRVVENHLVKGTLRKSKHQHSTKIYCRTSLPYQALLRHPWLTKPFRPNLLRT